MVNHAQLSPSTQGLLGSQSTEEEITLQYSNQIVAMIKSNRSQTVLQHSLKIESHGPREKGRKERVHRKKKKEGALRHDPLPSMTLELTTPLQHHQEDYKQLMGEPMMIRISSPSGFRTKGFPSHRSSGRCCT
jgi:hypothetical protein